MVDYDPENYPRFAITVDVVPLAIVAGEVHVLLIRRDAAPYAGQWTVPGGFVRVDEPIDLTALRVLRDKAGIAGVHVEQLCTFGAVDRDPRMRIVSVGHIALLPPARFAAIRERDDLRKARLDPADGTPRDIDDAALPLGFDHRTILAVTLERLRGKLDYSDIAFALLPDAFTLRQLQDVHEALLGRTLNKPAFRRRMLDRGWLEATGQQESGASHRPAELFRRRV